MLKIRLFLTTLLLMCSIGGHVHASCFRNCTVDENGYLLIRQFEGYSAFVYKDVVGIETIGFGHVIRPGEKIKTPLLGPAALKLLEKDVRERTAPLNKMLRVPLETCQFNAIASFSYNVGLGNLQKSTLLKRVNAGKHDDVPMQLMKWDKAGGKVYRGLVVRRETESGFYRGILCPSLNFTFF